MFLPLILISTPPACTKSQGESSLFFSKAAYLLASTLLFKDIATAATARKLESWKDPTYSRCITLSIFEGTNSLSSKLNTPLLFSRRSKGRAIWDTHRYHLGYSCMPVCPVQTNIKLNDRKVGGKCWPPAVLGIWSLQISDTSCVWSISVHFRYISEKGKYQKVKYVRGTGSLS